MLTSNYPSPVLRHRQVDFAVHAIGLMLICVGSGALLGFAHGPIWASIVYLVCALASNLSSQAYHFAPWHKHRLLLRRLDHAAIYLSITGTFTPLLVAAGTPRALTILALSWICAALGLWLKLVSREVKSRWSTASYLGLGLLSFIAIPDVYAASPKAVWLIVLGSLAYVVGTAIYAQKTMPYRYALWHICVTVGAIFLFFAVWTMTAT